jgi:NADPH:quinone reductase-like Zn-dependent oxidoreductase
MTKSMRVVKLKAAPNLDNLEVTDAPLPDVGPGQALVRVRATSLNYHDYLVVAGFIPQPPGRIPMSDGAGEVVDLGRDANGVAVGDHVIGAFFPGWVNGAPSAASNAAISGETVDGFAAEYVAVPASSLVRMPRDWTFAQAATLPCAGLTAWRALRVEGELQAGASVLLPGSGGLSVYALQLASEMGLVAVLTSSSDEKLAKLERLGAAHQVNYARSDDWASDVRAVTAGIGVDLALEIGGASSFAQSVAACRMGGQVMVVGSTSNAAPELPLREVVMRHIRVQGMAVGSVAMLRDLVDFIERQGIRPIIDRTYSFEQLADAFKYQLTGRHLGKIVVTI